MKNSDKNIKSTEANSCSGKETFFASDEQVKSIFKAALNGYNISTLCLYCEALVELINEKKEQERGKN